MHFVLLYAILNLHVILGLFCVELYYGIVLRDVVLPRFLAQPRASRKKKPKRLQNSPMVQFGSMPLSLPPKNDSFLHLPTISNCFRLQHRYLLSSIRRNAKIDFIRILGID